MCKTVLASVSIALVFTGCAQIVPLKPDSKWHTVYSLQVPAKSVELEVVSITATRPECTSDRIPEKTEIRILISESFQNLDQLPDRLEDAKPRDDGIPTKQADSGNYDLTLVGAMRMVPLISGKQLIARSWDGCTALKLIDRTENKKQ